jgi:RNA polymerase sigma-70 factor (ECF subfamily)
VLKGHTEEYRELMVRHQDSVFRLACRILGRREDAEDVVQEAFVKAYSHLADCRQGDRFWPWIRRIALNICLRRMPREYPCKTIDDLADSSSGPASPVEAEVLQRADTSHVRKAVAELPPAHRTVLVLRYEESLSYKEIAELIGESVDVVRIRLHRAKKTLAGRLAVMMNEMC